MIRKAFLFTALAAVIGASTGPATNALAADQGGPASGASKGAAMFDECDKNSDGRLSADEFKNCHRDSARAEKKFKKMNANHDGSITRDEAQQWLPTRRALVADLAQDRVRRAANTEAR